MEGQDWSSDPFTLRENNGKLFGRGTCDMKGFDACVLAMAPVMAKANLQKPMHIAFSYDEEIGCVGVRGLLQELRGRPVTPEACFVGEPSEMNVVIGHKGKHSYKVHVDGHAVHSALAPEGVNAVENGARLVTKIRDIGARLAVSGPRDGLYEGVTHSTAHVGTFCGGTALNIVPSACEFVFEFRYIVSDDDVALVEEVRAFARDVLEPEMKTVNAASGIRFELMAHVAGLDSAPDAGVVQLAKRLAGRNDHTKVSFGTEAGLFSTFAGIPSVICGPGSIDQAHKPDEFVEAAQLQACEEFIARVIDYASAVR